LGVACFQLALKEQPSAVVLPIVAITPLVVIPFAYFMEGEAIALRSILGGVIAVLGAVGLALAK
jgi:drug/metabolite transporter (DMT)-like permease